ncbi:hypothetical protein D3C71_351480 [compost metagenome]|jgi:hypothetical protein
MTTALELINRAYTLLGVKDPGQALDGTMVGDALDVLNTMIDSWRTEEFFVYQVNELVYSMSPNQQTVTIGPGMQIDTPVPLKIERGVFVRSGGIDYQVAGIDRVQYAQIMLKTTGSSFPSAVFYDRAYPSGTLYFWPLPAGAYELHLPLWLQLSEFDDVKTDIQLAPGYRRALEYSLAEELAPGLVDLPASVIKTGIRARANVKRVNRETPVLDVPIDLQVGRRFNIFSGQ